MWMMLRLVVMVILASAFNCGSPEQVKVALTGIPDQMSITWVVYKDTPFKNKISKRNPPRVEYGYEKGLLNLNETAIETVTYTTTEDSVVEVKEVVLKKLKKGTTVHYRVVDGDSTEEFSFPTSLELGDNGGRKTKPFKFITYGDMDVNTNSEGTLALVKKIIKSDPEVKFIIHQGDIPYAWGGAEDKWDSWGDMAQPVTANIPYMVTVGNHESDYDFKTYKHRFTNKTGINSKNAKNGNIYYSFNYQNVHFIALSTEHDYTKNSLQYKWLVKDLENIDHDNTPYTIIYAHRPMYCSNNNHKGDTVGEGFRKAIAPLLDKNDVDLILFGHVHAYERTCPIKVGKCGSKTVNKYYHMEPTGTVHLTIGTAGYESNNEWEKKPEWSVHRETSHGLVLITVVDNTLMYGQYIRNNGTIGDVFMIDRGYNVPSTYTAPIEKKN